MTKNFDKCRKRIEDIEKEYEEKAKRIQSLSDEQLKKEIRESLWGTYGISPDFRHAERNDLLNYKIMTDIDNPITKDLSVAHCKCLTENDIKIPESIVTTTQLRSYLRNYLRPTTKL